MKRNLHEDLAICESASSSNWINSGSYVEEYDRLTEEGCDLIGTFERDRDALFCAEAREGWPEAIKRAINAEAELREVTASLRELEVLFVTEEDKRCHYEALADRLAAENERFRAELMAVYQRAQNDINRREGGQCYGTVTFQDYVFAKRLVLDLAPVIF